MYKRKFHDKYKCIDADIDNDYDNFHFYRGK